MKKTSSPQRAASATPEEKLVHRASEAMATAIAPYSNFRVGAALETAAGKIYTGHNIESPAYSLTMCAERVAMYKALSDGERTFTRIAIVASSGDLCPPCGACRQVLSDFAGNLEIILSDEGGELKKIQIESLLPHSFGAAELVKTPQAKKPTPTVNAKKSSRARSL